MLVHRGCCPRGQDLKRRSRLRRCGRRSQPRRLQDRLQLARADDRIDLGDVPADLVAVSLHQASGNDQPLRLTAMLELVLHHLEDGIHRLLLGGIDEATGVDDEDLSVLGARGQLTAGAVEQPHHHLGVNQVLRAAQRYESDLRP